MEFLFGAIFGSGITLALCWQRLRELRRVFLIACEMIDHLRERERRHRGMLTDLFAEARRFNQKILSGSATPPAAAGTIARRHSLIGAKLDNVSGPSHDGRSRFLGGGNAGQ